MTTAVITSISAVYSWHFKQKLLLGSYSHCCTKKLRSHLTQSSQFQKIHSNPLVELVCSIFLFVILNFPLFLPFQVVFQNLVETPNILGSIHSLYHIRGTTQVKLRCYLMAVTGNSCKEGGIVLPTYQPKPDLHNLYICFKLVGCV